MRTDYKEPPQGNPAGDRRHSRQSQILSAICKQASMTKSGIEDSDWSDLGKRQDNQSDALPEVPIRLLRRSRFSRHKTRVVRAYPTRIANLAVPTPRHSKLFYVMARFTVSPTTLIRLLTVH